MGVPPACGRGSGISCGSEYVLDLSESLQLEELTHELKVEIAVSLPQTFLPRSFQLPFQLSIPCQPYMQLY